MRKRLLLTIAILALSFVGAYWFGSRTKGPQQPARQVIEGLAVDIADLKAGEVWEEKQYIHRLPIRNTTNTDIEILSFIKSCSCTEVEPRRLTIPAGQTATVNLIIDLTHRTMAELDLAMRPFAIEVKPYLKTGWPRSRGWIVEGTVKSRVALDTKAVHFGERPVYGQPPVKLKVVATAHVPVEKLEATLDKKVVSVEIIRRAKDPSKYDVVLTTEPSLPPGDFEANLQLDVVTPAGERLYGATLPVAGKVQPEVRPLPAKILLSSKLIGETADAVVVLQAPKNMELIVEQIETDSPDTHVEPITVEGSPAGRTYRVSQRVTKSGDQSCQVRFRIRMPGSRMLILPMEVCYHGRGVASSTEFKDNRDNRSSQ